MSIDWRRLTDARGQSVIPLCKGIRDSLAADGGRAVQRVSGVALEHHGGTHSEVVADALSKSWLRHGAALSGTGPWHSCKGTAEFQASWLANMVWTLIL